MHGSPQDSPRLVFLRGQKQAPQTYHLHKQSTPLRRRLNTTNDHTNLHIMAPNIPDLHTTLLFTGLSLQRSRLLPYPTQGYYQPQNAASPQPGEHISEVPIVIFPKIPLSWVSQLINQLTNCFSNRFRSRNNEVSANTAKSDFIMNNLNVKKCLAFTHIIITLKLQQSMLVLLLLTIEDIIS